MIDIYTLMSLVLTSAVVVAYINHRYIHLQPTIAIMLSSLLLSLGLIIAGQFGYTHLQQQVAQILARIDF